MLEEDIAEVAFNADGLVPAIVQEDGTGKVLMMAWMNEATLRHARDGAHDVLEPVAPGALGEGRHVR